MSQSNEQRRADLEKRIERARAEGKFAIAKALTDALNELPPLEPSRPPDKPAAIVTPVPAPPVPPITPVAAPIGPEAYGLQRAIQANVAAQKGRHVATKAEPLTGLQKAIQANIESQRTKDP